MKHYFRRSVLPALGMALFAMLTPQTTNAALSGTYTIDPNQKPSTTNYNDFNSAVSDLLNGTRPDGGTANGSGVNGPVTFKVANGTYPEQIVLTAVSGASATNRITFVSDAGDNSKVILVYTVPSVTNDYTIMLNGADYITFQDMTIMRGQKDSLATVIRTLNGANYNHFIGNRIIGKNAPASSTNWSLPGDDLVYMSGVDTQNVFERNHFINGLHGIYMNSGSSPTTRTVNYIHHNRFDSAGAAALYIVNQIGTIVNDNEIYMQEFSTPAFVCYAIRFNTSQSFKIYNNKCYVVSNAGTIRTIMFDASVSPSSAPAAIYNNFVSTISTTGNGPVTGLSINGTTAYTNLYFNNFYVESASSSIANAVLYVYANGSGSNNNVVNNILYHAGSGYAVSAEASTIFGTFDYNILYSKGGYLANTGGATGTDFKSLSDWQTSTGYDANSLVTDPQYISAQDLHITNTALVGEGLTISGYEFDIDVQRRESPPTIGADEILPAGLKGAYTIDATKPATGNNYKSFTAAVSDMLDGKRTDGGLTNGLGVRGAVIFNVANGTYNEQIFIEAIKGVTASWNVVFQSASGDSSKVILQYSAQKVADDYTVKLDGASYITFKGMTIKRGQTDPEATVVHLTGGSHYNKFLNNRLYGKNTTSTSTNFSIHEDDVVYISSLDSMNVFENNHIKNGLHGIFINPGTTVSVPTRNFIRNNTFDSAASAGIYVWYHVGTEVSGNRFNMQSMPTTAFVCYAVRFDNAASFSILNNKMIVNTDAGTVRTIMLSNDVSPPVAPAQIANNFISVTASSSSGPATGISINGSTSYLVIYHNSIRVNSSSTNTANAPVHIYANATGGDIYVGNNILVNAGTGFAVSYETNSIVTAQNYNALYAPNGTLGHSGGNNYSSLSAWTSATGYDANSIVANPQFVSATDLHITNKALRGKGLTQSFVTVDIDGTPRSNPPTIGAHELIRFANDASAIAILTSSVCEGTQPVNITIENAGSSSLTSAKIGWNVNGVAQTDYSWTGTLATDARTNVNIGSASFSGTSADIKVWTFEPNSNTDGDKTNDTAMANIIVNALPGALAGVSTAICTGDTVNIGAASIPGSTYVWTSEPAGFNSTASSILVSPTETTVYYLKETITATGCTKSDSVIITVNPLPMADAGADAVICSGETANIGSAAVMGSTYEWTSVPAGFVSTASLEIVSPTVTTVYYLKETITATGCTKTDSVIVSVNEQPMADAGADAIICDGSSADLGAAPMAGYAYNWESLPSGFTANTAQVNVSPSAKTTYILTVTNNATGCKGTDTVEVDIAPSFTPIISGSNIVCGTTSNYSTPLNTGSNYVWEVVGGTITNGDGTHSIEINWDAAGTHRVKVTETSSGSCVAFDEIFVTVGMPEAFFGISTPLNNGGICLGNDIQFSDSSKDAASYMWNFGDGNTSTDANPLHTYTTAGNFTVKLVITSVEGCVDSNSRTVIVHSVPGSFFTFNQTGNTVKFTPAEGTHTSYSWNFGDGNTSTDKEPEHAYASAGVYNVSLTVTNANGCASMTMQQVDFTTGISKPTIATSINVYPNPFRNAVNVAYELDRSARVQVTLFDLTGKQIAIVLDEQQGSGQHNKLIDANQYNLKAGNYLLRIQYNNQVISKQILKVE